MVKVLALTGIRSEYDILYPVINNLNESENFNLRIVASGAHLSSWHSNSIDKIYEDGFEVVDKIDSLINTDRLTQRTKGVGMLIQGLSQVVDRENPDVLIVVGDREESIAAAVVGNYMDVLTAHINGGDPVYGNADDPIRFAVSKLAHIHFTFTQAYSQNLEQVGEESFRIFNVGNPALENIKNVKFLDLKEISKRIGFDLELNKYILFIKHPLSSESSEAGVQMERALESLSLFCRKYGYKVVGSYPNTDPGSAESLKVIQGFSDPNIRFFKGLDRETFVNLVRNCSCIAGNSSMGVLEAPYYKKPVVNIGNRQRGRLNAGNLRFVGYEVDSIISELELACFDQAYKEKATSNPYLFGDGNSSERINQILTDLDYNDRNWYVKKKLC